MAKNNKTRFFYVLYSDKTRVFDQSERAYYPIYIIKKYIYIYMTNEGRSAELVMIISYPASPSRIIVLLKTLRHIIENLKEKSERYRNAAIEKAEKRLSIKCRLHCSISVCLRLFTAGWYVVTKGKILSLAFFFCVKADGLAAKLTP